MVLSIVITILFFLFSVINLKKTVIVTATTLLLMPQWLSGIPGVRMQYIVIIFQIMCAFIKGDFYNRGEYPKVVIIPCMLASIGYLISDILGRNSHLALVVVNILCYFVYPFVVWKQIRTSNDIDFAIRTIVSFFSFACIYTVVEFVLRHNIIADLAVQGGFADNMGLEEADEKFGLLKCSSIFSWTSAMGMASSFTFFILLYLKYLHYKFKQPVDWMFFLLPFCVLVAGSRSQMMVFAMCLFTFFFVKEFRGSKTYKTMTKITVMTCLLSSGFLTLLIDSIIHSNNYEIGSSSDMRLQQLEICLMYWQDSPIFGLGRMYMWDYVRPYHNALYGAESVWFQMIVDYGIVGCLTFLLIILGAVVWVSRYKRMFIAIPIAYIVGKTISIVMGIEINYMLTCCVVLVKAYQLYDTSIYPSMERQPHHYH